jgi:branched-subunit amino acid transport protein
MPHFLPEMLLIAGMALVTFGIRYGMFALSQRLELPAALVKALRYVPPVVLTAIVVPAVLIPDGQHLQLTPLNARLIGAITAFLVGWFSRNLLLTIVVGMAVFLLWQTLVTR